MERKEAIEIVRKLYNESLFLKKDKEAMVTLIPELAKSEDEIIREEIIDFLRLPHPQFVGKRDHEQWIAWLEKRGEQKDILEDAVLDGNKDGLIADTIRYKTEKQSVECIEDNLPEFESYLCLMFQKFRTKGVCTNGEIIDFVKEHSQKLKDTLCHAWSEEDELNLSEALHHIRMYNLAYKADKLDKWLKSIKERLQPQHGLSEEDYNEIETIACHLDNINNEGMAKVLRSIIDKYYSQSIDH